MSEHDDKRPPRDTSGQPDLTLIKNNAQSPVRRVIRWTVRMIILGAAVFIALFVWQNADRLAPSRIEEWFDSIYTSAGVGNGFPLPVAGSVVRNMDVSDGDIAFLTDTSLMLVNDTGYEIVNRQHGFQTPVMRLSDMRALIYDRGGTGYRVEGRRRTIYTGDADEKILAGDIGPGGQMLLVTRARGNYIADMRLYDRDGNRTEFQWLSAENLVLDAAIAPDEKGAAAILVSAEEGDIVSTAAIFNFYGGEPKQIAYPGTLLTAVRYCGDRILLIGDDQCISLSLSGDDPIAYSYKGDHLAAFSIDSGGSLAVALSSDRDRGGASLIFLDAKLTAQGFTDHTGSIHALFCSGDRVAVLMPGRALLYNQKGQLQATLPAASASSAMCIAHGEVYVAGVTGIDRLGGGEAPLPAISSGDE